MTDTPKENGEIRDEKGRFVQGNPGGPGRPQGSVSIITKIKQIWEKDPERFEQYVEDVLKDEKLRGQIINHIDGAPKESKSLEVSFPTPILDLTDVSQDNSNEENSSPE